MYWDMKKWMSDMLQSPTKKAMPILSFPSVQLMGITVSRLISDSALQAKGMKAIADRVDSCAALSMMDLSVEAEAFGAPVRISEDEVPTVTGGIVSCREEADALRVPAVGEGRTGLYIEAVKKACGLIADRPVLAGVIGPYSLSGRLIGVSEIMIDCYEEPEMVKTVMEKASEFIIGYIRGYKAAGANGAVMAEPLTGLLSPELASEFSETYVRAIIDAVQDDDFIVVYHNCGNNTLKMIDSILRTGASAYHFGNAVDMAEVLEKVPSDTVVMGNIDPAGQFKNGTPVSMRDETLRLLERCGKYPNFIISSGCDIPPSTPFENIDAFFGAVAEYYRDNRK